MLDERIVKTILDKANKMKATRFYTIAVIAFLFAMASFINAIKWW